MKRGLHSEIVRRGKSFFVIEDLDSKLKYLSKPSITSRDRAILLYQSPV